MKRRSLRLVLLAVALIVVGSILAVPAKRYWAARKSSRLIIESEELVRKSATEQEVRRVLGDPGPDGIFNHGDSYDFVYVGPRAQGRFVYLVVLTFSSKTHRVKDMAIGKP